MITGFRRTATFTGILLAIAAGLSGGCAPKIIDYGAAAPTKHLDLGGKARVYVTRTGFNGFAVPWVYSVNGGDRFKLWRRRYTSFEFDPGPVSVDWISGRTRRVTFDAAADSVYFVRGRVLGASYFIFPQMEVMDPAKGEESIGKFFPANNEENPAVE